ncbi:MAG TPA: hypothetical protein VEC11_06195 [Allosphingosinicella sp.]|nr:hypothetical protein [Allosphingosinicella sp.]
MRMIIAISGLLALCVAPPAAAQTLPANRTLEPTPEVAAAIRPGSTLRIEADLAPRAAGWRGVRNCHRAERARSALRAAFDSWLGAQVRAHPGRRVLRHGWNTARYTYRNGRDPWPDNSRWCRGRLVRAPAYVEFH